MDEGVLDGIQKDFQNGGDGKRKSPRVLGLLSMGMFSVHRGKRKNRVGGGEESIGGMIEGYIIEG